jgi:hypothetical protein
MKKQRITPEQMNLIINIQILKSKIYPNYDQFYDFRNLALLNIEQLRRLQERLIPEYNKTFER